MRLDQGLVRAYAQFSFTTPLGVEEDPVCWWQKFEETTNGGILAVRMSLLHSLEHSETLTVVLGNRHQAILCDPSFNG